MKLYLCRHAVAEESAPGGDSRRALSAEGRTHFARVAAGLATMKPQIEIIFTSPYLRARQTAEIMAKTLDRARTADGHHKTAIVPASELACGGAPELLRKRLRSGKHPPHAIMAVGHAPDLENFLGQLCFGKPGRVRFKKGAVACAKVDDALTQGELLFLMQPRQLAALSKT